MTNILKKLSILTLLSFSLSRSDFATAEASGDGIEIPVDKPTVNLELFLNRAFEEALKKAEYDQNGNIKISLSRGFVDNFIYWINAVLLLLVAGIISYSISFLPLIGPVLKYVFGFVAILYAAKFNNEYYLNMKAKDLRQSKIQAFSTVLNSKLLELASLQARGYVFKSRFVALEAIVQKAVEKINSGQSLSREDNAALVITVFNLIKEYRFGS